jgi:hypothetical protein
MTTYAVYQQHTPLRLTDSNGNVCDYQPNLVKVGEVVATNGASAIKLARATLPAFRHTSRRSLMAFPIVEALVLNE